MTRKKDKKRDDTHVFRIGDGTRRCLEGVVLTLQPSAIGIQYKVSANMKAAGLLHMVFRGHTNQSYYIFNILRAKGSFQFWPACLHCVHIPCALAT